MALTTATTIAGNLTSDPELRADRNGKPYVRVSIASNPRRFNRDTKEWEDGEPVYVRGVAFGEFAEHIAHSLRKGMRVLAHGTLKTESWEDKNSGVKMTDKTLQIEDLGASLMFANVSATKAETSQRAYDNEPSAAAYEQRESAYGDDTPF